MVREFPNLFLILTLWQQIVVIVGQADDKLTNDRSRENDYSIPAISSTEVSVKYVPALSPRDLLPC